jgi:DNA-binding response OmpR family regulator
MARGVSVMLLDLESSEASFVTSLFEQAGITTSLGRSTDSLPASSATSSFDAVVIGSRAGAEGAGATCAKLRQAGYRGAIVVLGEQGSELGVRLRAILHRATSHARIRCGAVVIDSAQRAAYVNGRALKLTGREYELLVCLTEAGGKMVTRADLLARVWKRSDHARSNLIEAHMSRLRDKLGADSVIIETVRRAGYRLRPQLRSG